MNAVIHDSTLFSFSCCDSDRVGPSEAEIRPAAVWPRSLSRVQLAHREESLGRRVEQVRFLNVIQHEPKNSFFIVYIKYVENALAG